MKKSKLDLIYPVDELNINTWKLWDPGKCHKLIELIKIISKKYLNIMKKSKLALIYPVDALDVNTWTLWNQGKYHKLIKLFKIISRKI